MSRVFALIAAPFRAYQRREDAAAERTARWIERRWLIPWLGEPDDDKTAGGDPQ